MTKAQATRIVSRMQRAYAEMDAYARGMNDRFLQALVRAEGRLLRQTEAFVADMPALSGMTMQRRLAWYSSEAKRLGAWMAQSGYPEAVRAYADELRELAEFAERLMRSGGVSAQWARVPADYVRFTAARDVDRFAFLSEQARRRLDDALLDGVMSGAPKSGLLQELRGVITGEYPWGERTGLYEWHAGTYARTATHRHCQEFLNLQAERAGLEHFMYIGPLDNRTREFCAGLVGRVFTREEIDDLDNGQSGLVFTDGGGWNCRHEWVGVSAELAETIGKDDDDEFRDVAVGG